MRVTETHPVSDSSTQTRQRSDHDSCSSAELPLPTNQQGNYFRMRWETSGGRFGEYQLPLLKSGLFCVFIYSKSFSAV